MQGHSLTQSAVFNSTPKMAEKKISWHISSYKYSRRKKKPKYNKLTGKHAHDWILPFVSHPHLWDGMKGQFSAGAHKHWLRYSSWVNPGWTGYKHVPVAWRNWAVEPMTLVQLWLQADGISLFLHLQSVELCETKIYRFLLLTLNKGKSDFHKDHDLRAPVDFNQWLAILEKNP